MDTAVMNKIPTISWYQRKDTVIVKFSCSVPIPDDYQLKIDPNKHLEFVASEYKCAFELSNSVDIQEVKPNGNTLTAIFKKKTDDQGFWNKLTVDKNLNRSHISVDWLNWEDEDSEDESKPNQFDFGDQQTMAAMQTLQGMDWSQLNNDGSGSDSSFESDSPSENTSNDSDNDSTDRVEIISESRQ
jgi:hypothetical protein